MLLPGCKSGQRNTRKHDVFFGVGNGIKGSVAVFGLKQNNRYIDTWQEVIQVGSYSIRINLSDD
jgi:hypothetical protein